MSSTLSSSRISSSRDLPTVDPRATIDAVTTRKPATSRVRTVERRPPAVVLDDVSKAIIEQLQEDGRQSYATIGKSVGLSEAAVRQRVQRLLDAGVMQIVAVTDPLQVGFRRQAMIGIRIEGDTRARSRTRSPRCRRSTTSSSPRAASTCSSRSSARTTTHLLDLLSRRIRTLPGVSQHRDLRLSQAPQAALQLGNPMTTDPRPSTSPRRDRHTPHGRAVLRRRARPPLDALHPALHVRGRRAAQRADHRPRRGRLHLGRPRQASTSTAWPGCSSSRSATAASELAEAAAKQAARAGVLPALVLRAPARRSSWPSGWRSYAPGDLNRVFFTTGGGEAVETAWKLAKQYFKLIGKPTKHKVISRAVAYHGTPQGALSITGIPDAKEMFEPLVPGRASRCRTPTTTARRSTCATTPRRSAAGPRTGSTRRSSSRAPTPSPRSSSSRCRTPAAASRRRPATSSGSARSATSTTCCSSPTRSSARSAGSATCSPATTSATSRTSSPAPRG